MSRGIEEKAFSLPGTSKIHHVVQPLWFGPTMKWSSTDKSISQLFPLIILLCAGGSELLSLP